MKFKKYLFVCAGRSQAETLFAVDGVDGLT